MAAKGGTTASQPHRPGRYSLHPTIPEGVRWRVHLYSYHTSQELRDICLHHCNRQDFVLNSSCVTITEKSIFFMGGGLCGRL